MKDFSKQSIIILGSGCAGLTAAIYAARANLSPLLIEGSLPGGLLTMTSEIENFPGFPEGISGFELMDRMRKQAERFGTQFLSGQVDRVELSEACKRVFVGDRFIETEALIIATGASPKFLKIPGEKEMFGGKGVSICATCDGAFYRNRDVIVIGGGDSACEEALFLTHFCKKVTIVHRRDQLRASKILADRVQSEPKIELVWNAVPQAILADENGFTRGMIVQDKNNSQSREIACEGVFLAVGHEPNTKLFHGILPLDDSGYFIKEPNSQTRTAVGGVFVAGDCADPHYRQAISAAGTGCQAAIEAERYVYSRQSSV
ncbi:MAG: thioredoxin-disulfide reductase [Verrucomicrobia bacterium GWF2_51_19]|nr:MAG: thioredoxin-disulfide reductase [Verrucomicrobia bacterium GWF2_51_19]HCJ12078.1 thioredoxin-disulfide reductase [Opitutae bacterium]